MYTPKNHYYPQLDSLRAFAVVLVIVSHWFGHTHFFNRYTSNGILGVTLFFVLSGFLITQILLKSKTSIEQKRLTITNALKIFYIRRSLRIFPLYYLVLLLVLVFPIVPLVNSFTWHLLYASNIYFWKEAHFQGQLSHLWSLSVEEQFYLFWPAIILIIPSKKLPYLFVTGIAFAIAFRFYFHIKHDVYGRLLMPGSLDSFCLGALLAYGVYFLPCWFLQYRNNALIIYYTSCMVLVFVEYVNSKYHSVLFLDTAYFVIISLFFAQLIYFTTIDIKNVCITKVLNGKIFKYLGKISYGLYIYHNFIPYLYGIPLPSFLQVASLYIVQFLRFAILVAVASLSWFLLENKILKFKNKFNY